MRGYTVSGLVAKHRAGRRGAVVETSYRGMFLISIGVLHGRRSASSV